MKNILYLLMFSLLCCPSFLLAQQQAAHWYFGNRGGIDFTGTVPTVVTDGAMRAAEGCSSMCDSSGNLLFYTDGIQIWNRNHTQMSNGFGLKGGRSCTQAALIVPAPQSSTLFYIFTVAHAAQPDGLQYSVVDMSKQNGVGEVITKNIPLITPVAEKLTAVQHRNNRDIWVLVHGWGNNAFYAFLVTPTGIQTSPVLSSIGTVHTGSDINALGAMKASPQGNTIAVATENIRSVEVFNFDNSTGMVSHPIQLPPLYPMVYGVEFSPDGTKLYFTTHKEEKALYQADLTSGNAQIIASSVQKIATFGQGFGGALQLAPDNRIYVARLLEGYIGAITKPNNDGIQCGYDDKALHLQGATSQLGLPNFIQSYFYIDRTITAEHLCLGETTMLKMSHTDDILSMSWQFGDPASGSANTSTEKVASHAFTTSGTYQITVSFTTPAGNSILTHWVTIQQPPTVTIVQNGALCPHALLTPQVTGNVTSYRWSTGETSASIRIPSEGVYHVTVSNSSCHSTASVQVTFGNFAISVPSDTLVICQGESVQLQADGAIEYEWTPAISLDNNTLPTPTATPTETTIYTVWGKNAHGCEDSKQIVVQVIPLTILQCSIPDTIGSVGDSNFMLPITAHVAPQYLPLLLPTLSIDVEVNALAFAPTLVTDGVMSTDIQGDKLLIHIEMQDVRLINPQQALTSIHGTVLLGPAKSTPLHFASVQTGNCEQQGQHQGTLTLQGCAIEKRYIDFGTPLRISISSANTKEEAVLTVQPSLPDTYKVVVYTMHGAIVWQQKFLHTDESEQTYQFLLPTHRLSPGMYCVLLSSSQRAMTLPFSILP